MEILVWVNLEDPDFDVFLRDLQAAGHPVRVVGKTPENIGMAAYLHLFRHSQYTLIVQIDDDVAAVSRNIAQRANEIFTKFPKIKQLTADVWQDDYTTGARPPLAGYTVFNREHGLYNGPIDGWFSVYHRSILPLLTRLPRGRYMPLGGMVRQMLRKRKLYGLLCTRMKVFHVIGPAYANYFNMLDFEIRKYRELGREDIVQWYSGEIENLPSRETCSRQVEEIMRHLDQFR